ncbi:alpha/beta fold hydrolase [Geodermatophilus sp. CPCC 205761]|uniref:alpha/beta fold hydrolase n=1 Tax=Geodermatophilus sp. CPCC 205761 TaxID=2936597 RepID=UPI003EED413D
MRSTIRPFQPEATPVPESSCSPSIAARTARTHLLDGHPWRILRSGVGSHVVLLLPGGVGQAEAEFQVIRALEPHVQVLAVTYPALTSMAAMVRGLMRVLDAEGLTTVDVWGNSFGGMVAQALVREAPHRVGNLVLGRTAVPDPARRRRAQAQARLLGALPDAVVRRLVRAAFARRMRDLPDDERTSWVSYLEDHFLSEAKQRMASLSALAADFHARADMTADDLAGRPGRVLLLEADGDELYGGMTSRLHELYPAAAVHRLTSGGHVSDAARVREEAAVVVRFLADPDSFPAQLRIRSDGVTLAARRFGSAGDVVVLLHGGPGCPDYLEPVARHLASRFRALTFDQRGVGASTANGRYGLADHVADVEAIRRSLGADGVHLFGHSWGGLLAQLYLRQHPQRVRSLVLANSSAGVGAEWIRMQREVMAYNRRQSGAAGFAALGAESLIARLPGRLGDAAGQRVLARIWANYFPDPATAPPADRSWLRGAHGRPARATVAAIRTAPASVLDGPGARTDLPVLVVYGRDDIYGSSVDAVRRRFPGAQDVVLDDCGHVPWLQASDRFSALLDAFYAGVPRGPHAAPTLTTGPRLEG